MPPSSRPTCTASIISTTRRWRDRSWQLFLRLNLYKNPASDEQTLAKELLATRIYIYSLPALILIILFAAAFINRTVNRVNDSPSYAQFSELMNKYSSTLHCPCSKTGIAYDTFVSVNVSFHQVCSSEFIEQEWIDLVFSESNRSSPSLDDFRLTLSFFWQSIANFCKISDRIWMDTMDNFGASHIFSSTAMSDPVIRAEVQAAINNRINSARITLIRNLLAIRRTTSGNQIVSALATNFYLRYPPEVIHPWTSLKLSSRTFNECSCLNFEGCPHPATFDDSEGNPIHVAGMIADCLIIDGTLASTLQCYYDQICFSVLHPSLSTRIQPLSDQSNGYLMSNSTIEKLLNNLMIDQMTTAIRSELYYSQCQPAYCAYSYTHRFDVLFIITTIIGIFGGLSFLLRFIASLIASTAIQRENKLTANHNLSSHAKSIHQWKCKFLFCRQYYHTMMRNRLCYFLLPN